MRGELRLCEGHIARIAGLYRHDGKELATAVERFTEAKQLMPRSPDPELALAQLYVYGHKDLDKAYDALRRAQKLGHPLGNREKQQLADGYLERAGELIPDAQNVRGLPQEKDQIGARRRRLQPRPGTVPGHRSLRPRHQVGGPGAERPGRGEFAAGANRRRRGGPLIWQWLCTTTCQVLRAPRRGVCGAGWQPAAGC